MASQHAERVVEEPMVVDSGLAGLEQSVHHPRAGVSATGTPLPGSGSGAGKGVEGLGVSTDLMQSFKDLVAIGKEVEFEQTLHKALRDAFQRGASSTTHNNNNNIHQELRAIRSTIDQLTRVPPAQSSADTSRKTWAAVAAAAAGAGGPAVYTPKVVVPERRNREIVVKATDLAPELAARTSVEIVEAVNKAMGGGSGSGRAVAARRMPSGDTVLTFSSNTDTITKDTEWVQTAFGHTAEVKRREFTVVAKGLPAARLRTIHDPQALLAELRQHTKGINRCRAHLPRQPGTRFAEVTLHMDSVATAQEACRFGVVFEAQIFNVEPYYAAAQVRRCFHCHSFGHIGRYCSKPARCGHCAATAHAGGEARCPEAADSGKKRCVNCSGAHTAWSRDCPTAQKEIERARQAYKHRPLQFAVTMGSGAAEATPQCPPPTQDLEGFQVVTSRKQQRPPSQRDPSQPPAKRGRPTGLARAARSCQGIATFSQGHGGSGSGSGSSGGGRSVNSSQIIEVSETPSSTQYSDDPFQSQPEW
jgi:hypothetical protein